MKTPKSICGPADTKTSRRTFLRFAGMAMIAAGAVGSLPAATALPAEAAPVSRTLDTVRAEALRSIGGRLRGSPWLAYFSGLVTSWSAMYISWLLRENGVTKTADVPTLWRQFAVAGRTGVSPRVGALIFYSHGNVNQPYHVGYVEQITNSVPQTIEGNGPALVKAEERFVRRCAYPTGRFVRYAYPGYSG